jgi:hypothetical protein
MATLAKALRSVAGDRTADRIFVLAGVIFLGFLVLSMRSTIAGMDPEVVIGSAQALTR